MKQRALAALWANSGPLAEGDLLESVEHSNPTVFRRKVLIPLHKAKLIEYGEDTKEIHISPLGVRFVEENIPLQI
jgi:hypothetical protein